LAFNGWEGVCFEWDPEKVASMADLYKQLQHVHVCRAKITPNTICHFLKAFGLPQRFGLLSLDIDSYDYFVLQALLQEYRPSLILAEINEKIPPPLEFTVLFDAHHRWDVSHFYGQSICQLEKLCTVHRYSIAHLEYNNAFLIDTDLLGHPGLTAEQAYQSGYLSRSDRKQRFPWNQDMEALLSMAPNDAIQFLNQFFAKYKGKYSLSIRGS
jgi:hypothetical protein